MLLSLILSAAAATGKIPKQEEEISICKGRVYGYEVLMGHRPVSKLAEPIYLMERIIVAHVFSLFRPCLILNSRGAFFYLNDFILK